MNIKTIFLIFSAFSINIACTTEKKVYIKYPYLSQLGPDSLLYQECEKAPQGKIFRKELEKKCVFLEEKLEKANMTGEGVKVWYSTFWKANLSNSDSYHEENKPAIRIILANYSDETKRDEFHKLCSLDSKLTKEWKAKQEQKQLAEEAEKKKYKF